ncbi:MAG: hypothetical protein JWO36_826 [Myxococcales bacterium]|nr:hypothetical protein [Myxococcales bacterium]
MRLLVVFSVLAACGGEPKPLTAKPPNDQLIVGEYERKPPDGTTAVRFDRDGGVRLAHDKSKLDGETLASGSWKLEGDQLSLNYVNGMCAGGGTGLYKVVISRLGIRFTKVEDACEQRAKIDGQIWHRIK